MDLTKVLSKDVGDLLTKYAAATGTTPDEVFGAMMGAMQPLLSGVSIQAGDRVVKSDLNIVVPDNSGNAKKCATRLQEIRNKVLDPKKAKELVESDAKRVETDPSSGKQKANLDDKTTDGLFVLKPDGVKDVVMNKDLDGNYLLMGGNQPVTNQPKKSKKQLESDAKVIKETEDVFANMFRSMLNVKDTTFRLTPEAEKALKDAVGK